MTKRAYSASLSQSQGRSGFSIIFRHPARLDAVDKPGVRVRRGLGTRDRVEAERLRYVVPDIIQVGLGEWGENVAPVHSRLRRLLAAARFLTRATASSPSPSSPRSACAMPPSTRARIAASRVSPKSSSRSRSPKAGANDLGRRPVAPTLDLAPNELFKLFGQRNIHGSSLSRIALPIIFVKRAHPRPCRGHHRPQVCQYRVVRPAPALEPAPQGEGRNQPATEQTGESVSCIQFTPPDPAPFCADNHPTRPFAGRTRRSTPRSDQPRHGPILQGARSGAAERHHRRQLRDPVVRGRLRSEAGRRVLGVPEK